MAHVPLTCLLLALQDLRAMDRSIIFLLAHAHLSGVRVAHGLDACEEPAQRMALQARIDAGFGRSPRGMSPRSSYKPRRIREGDPLTSRELEVLALVAAGETTPAICERLGVVENTVKSHLTSIYKKTGSANRVQAVRHYLDHYAGASSGTLPAPATGEPMKVGKGAGGAPLIERQIAEIEARLDTLAPYVAEAQELGNALDALRSIRPDEP
jgi:DNA-binding CsgD family transcriptional regulator